MCLFSVIYRVIPGCPLFILDNREEFYIRSTAPPEIVAETNGSQTNWLGGIDLEAGGTWLGVNEHGLVVAIINREKQAAPVEPRSRGELCRELLGLTSVEAAADHAVARLRTNNYAGCNIAILSKELAIIIEAADEIETTRLTPGIHAMTNGHLDDQKNGRVQRIKSRFEELERQSTLVPEWITSVQKFSSLHSSEDSSAICLHGEDRGTVSSTIIALTDDPVNSEYHYAAGPPCQTLFDNFSVSLRRILPAG